MPIANTLRVGIVGGGFAGLSAARHLLKHKAGDTTFDVTVFEARDRLGGRANTNYECGAPVDLGASWIHGIQENPVYALAQEYNISLSGDTLVNRGFYDTKTGEKIDESQMEHAIKIFRKIHDAAKFFGANTDDFAIPLESTYFTYLNNYRPELYEGLPVRPPPKENEEAQAKNSESTNSDSSQLLDDATDEENKKKRVEREGIVMGLMMVEQLITAARLNEISVMGWSKYREYEGHQVMFHQGYSSLINALSSTVFGEAAPTPASASSLSSASPSPSPSPSSSSSSSSFSSSSSSSSSSQRTATLLLSTPVTAINYESQDKISITTKQGQSYHFDHVIVTIPLGVLKAKLVSFVPPLLPFKTHAINALGFGVLEKIALKFNNKFWDSNIIGCLPTTEFGNEFLSFVSLYEIIHEPVLLVFVHGQFAKILQRMDKGKIQELVMRRIKEIFPACKEEPTHFIMSKWFEDPYSKGSYSFPAVGGGFRDIVNLTEPIQTRFGIPRVMFAGEATDPVYYGTTHAAFVSGEREGKRLIDSLINVQTKETPTA